MNLNQLKKQREKIDKQIKELELKDSYIDVPELKIRITKLTFKNKTYAEILKEVDESQIATYDILQKLRNISFKSNWKKYPFMKKFWAFVPNLDEYEKSKGKVAWFYANSGYAGLICDRGSDDSDSYLGVFLIKKMEKLKEKAGKKLC